MKPPLFEHQRRYLINNTFSTFHGLWWKMGTGKTRAILENVGHLADAGHINCLFVIAPNGVHTNWVYRECPKWLDIDYNVIIWSPKSTTKRWHYDADKALKDQETFLVIAMNVDAFSHKRGTEWGNNAMSLRAGRVLLCLDESSDIKTPGAKRTSNIIKLARKADYRRALTGTLITNSPFNSYSQCEFLEPGIMGYAGRTLKSGYFLFQKRYGVFIKKFMGNRSFDECVGYQNEDELRGKLLKAGSFVDKPKDLPNKIYQYRDITLDQKETKAYNTMAEAYMAEVGGEIVDVDNALSKLTKLHQITAGFVYNENHVAQYISNSRITALLDDVEKIDGKIIIWTHLVESLQQIEQELSERYGKDSVVEYWGGVSQTNREIAIDAFQNDPACRFFVANKSASRGLTLTAANTVIYYTNDYSLETREQSEDRPHREGQKNDVVYIDYVARGTVDEGVVQSLAEKIDVSTHITGFVNAWLGRV